MGKSGAIVLGHRRYVLGLVGAVVCGLALAPSAARAASMTTNCAGLQAALNQAADGDVITLDQLCTSTNSGSSAGAFTLPNVSFTLQGQPGSGAGFDGTAVASSLLSSTGGNSSVVTFTINNLIFQNASPATPANSGGGAISIQGQYGLSLDGDTFNNDNVAGADLEGGAVYLYADGSTGVFSITHSTFHANDANTAGGAVLIETDSPSPITITDNTFTSNAVTGPTGNGATGGALFVVGRSSAPQLTQSGNTFSGNSINGSTGDAWGGAEATQGVNDSFTGDTFTGNSLQAPASGALSGGSALAIFNNNCETTLSHVLTDVAVAGNSITDGSSNPANAWGAIYTGECQTSNNLTLINSTASGNRGGGGTAGIWGDPGDQLTLQNSILNGDTDGTELAGFGGTGGSVTVSYSDLCNGSAPQAGTGNICANPNLVNPGAGDVHETYSSPTIDAGSNSLVPNGLTTDVYGQPRIQPKLAGGSAVVDMGAAEFPTIQPPTATITTPADGTLYNQGQVVSSSFACQEASGGPGIASCTNQFGQGSGAAIDTSTPGQHTLTVSAKSDDGLSGSATVTYTVAGPPSVTITTPAHRKYYLNARVHSSFRCTEGPSGPGIASCLNGSGKGSGAQINTGSLGTHRFTVTARSKDGQVRTATVTYTVVRRPHAHRAGVHRTRHRPPNFTG